MNGSEKMAVEISSFVQTHNGPDVALDLPTKPELLRILDELTRDQNALIKIAERSYRHQLGFMKFVLYFSVSGMSIRLHHWDDESGEVEDIHSHCASFHSTVLTGEIQHQEFQLIPGQTHAQYQYRFNQKTCESEAQYTGMTDIVSGPTRTLKTGASYYMSAQKLHRVSLASIGTVTVSCWSPRCYDAIVLKPNKTVKAPCCARSGMEPIEVYQRLQEVIKRLKEK